MSKCKACDAPILWVKTTKGKNMPLDAKPYKMVVVKNGIGELVDAYMPHWATCPHAKEFRK